MATKSLSRSRRTRKQISDGNLNSSDLPWPPSPHVDFTDCHALFTGDDKRQNHFETSPRPDLPIRSHAHGQPYLQTSSFLTQGNNIGAPYTYRNHYISTQTLPLPSNSCSAVERTHPNNSGYLEGSRNPSPMANNLLSDHLSQRMSVVLTAMDLDDCGGQESDLDLTKQFSRPSQSQHRGSAPDHHRHAHDVSQNPRSGFNYFSKVSLYANSCLPPALPPLKLYLPTYPLLNLAARQALTVYNRHHTQTDTVHIPASSLSFHTRHITLTTTPLARNSSSDHTYIIVAIRGTSSPLDWASNLSSKPVAPPSDFLPDSGNLVHEGFLGIALASLGSIHQHISQVISTPSLKGKKTSLCMTGHSAGGAVASLLYSHLISHPSSAVKSELRDVCAVFRRIHCITFGAPPVTLLPLQKPSTSLLAMGREAKKLKKSVFLAFINEGDPVARADKTILRSLIRLCVSPGPKSKIGTGSSKQKRKPIWNVPTGTLSCAGRLVLLRDRSKDNESHKKKEKLGSQLEASVIDDSMLRGLIFGDVMAHSMKLYAQRIEKLAIETIVGEQPVSLST